MYSQFTRIKSGREVHVGQVVVFVDNMFDGKSLYHSLGHARDKDMYFYELSFCNPQEDNYRFAGIDFTFHQSYLIASFAIPGSSVIRVGGDMLVSGPNGTLVSQICRGTRG